ncbi:hypothetical protein TC41_2149 [Alicyclobacillus acidocaldarius subsp. acidocaldarius Tc-4-1]|uniref:Uncharacterized protein n=1 Tax=Alicyclobacillus acidocaldarius (strain Tc-4-1) TaxID=1048834 RepID=F8IF91_ALIAT|nr:hypothetical protein TC41_2149 [Alicyclobacillus acidocaldarius subsp. acidocaldarius Tc-4-1]
MSIYNQGIEDRIATLEPDFKDMSYLESWFLNTTADIRSLWRP